MIRSAARADLPAIRDLLVRANPTPYDIGVVADEKVFGPGYRGEPQVAVFDRGGTIAGVSVVCGRAVRLLAVDPLHRRCGIGTALLPDAARVVFAEAANYFTPGVIESDEGTRAFFTHCGFVESRWTWNLETDRLPEVAPAEVRRATLAGADRVLRFIAREFGDIWRFEAGRAMTRNPATLLFAEQDGEVVGFAAHDVNNRGLGFFGPTGVAKAMRGRGIGRALLLASLADLRRLGYGRVTIPWTDAVDFYRKSCGAEVTARFVTYSR